MEAMRTFSVKNFDKFQHYKDRTPPWIKLYNETLDDYEFGKLPDASKAHLIAIWLLASRSENKIPYDPTWVARRINATDRVDLDALAAAGFIIVDQELHTAEQSASKSLAKCLSRDRGEAEERRGREDNKTSSSGAILPSEAALRCKALETRLREAAGWEREPSPGLFTVGPIMAVMETGADLELDVLPTIRAKSGKCRNRSGWNFFIDAIKEAHAKRLEAGRVTPLQSAATADRENRKREAERFLAEHNARVAANG